MRRFVPSDEQRRVVERAAGIGLPQEKICQLIISKRTGNPIDKKTLAEAFRAELDRGMAKADYEVLGSLYDNATSGDTTAQIWWSKARCGWRDTTNINVTEQSALANMTEEELIGVKVNLRIG